MPFSDIKQPNTDHRDAKAFRLGSDLAVLIWDLPPGLPIPTRPVLTMSKPPVPLVSVTLSLVDGHQRTLWAMRTARAPMSAVIAVEGSDSAVPIGIEPASGLPPLDMEQLFLELAPEARIRFLNVLLTTWRSAFKVASDPYFSLIVEDALNALAPTPRPARITCELGRGRFLIETTINPEFDDKLGIYVVGAASVSQLRPKAIIRRGTRSAWQACHFIAEMPSLSPPFQIVLLSKNGIAIRQLSEREAQCPSLTRWWADNRDALELRELLVQHLAAWPNGGPATAIDLQVRAPLKERHVPRAAQQPSGQVDLALALSDSLLVGGWYHDPSSMLAGIDYLQADGKAVPLDGNIYEFPGWAQTQADKSKTDVTGFVARLPLDQPLGPLLQPRFQMRLASGAVKSLIPPPQPFEPVLQRNQILRAVPPQHAIDDAFRTILAPALREVEQRLGKTVEVKRTRDYGLPQHAPLVSIVIPLYKVLDFLRFQLSGMATDPWLMENAELVFVLDSPEIQDETEHLLGGLHLLHGLPMRLVVMNRNGGYARACNTGARMARGSVLVMLNSDVVPCEPGWVQTLIDPIMSGAYGAVGPRLIFEDKSLQHAGLYFGRDQRGIWLNHHFYKGMPSDYMPAQQARTVPGVTGACLVTTRDLYESVGGFTEDYIIGDYEDSDLCLKIRRAGFEIGYEPSACLYHFERQSIRRSQDYMRGVASQYNSWLHTQRWDDDIAALMARDYRSPSSPKTASPDDHAIEWTNA